MLLVWPHKRVAAAVIKLWYNDLSILYFLAVDI